MTNQTKFYNLLVLFFISLILGLASCSDSGDDDTGSNEEMNMMDQDNDNTLETAPDFTIDIEGGSKVSLKDYEDKVLVIFFFGSTCPPCITVGPSIESKLNEEFGNNSSFAIIGMDQWDGNEAAVKSFRDKTGVTFPLGLKGSGIAREYGTTYDRLVVINANGKITFKGRSIAANDLDETVNIVKGLLN